MPPRSAFARFRFPVEAIVLEVRWYLRYGLSFRGVEELLAERGIEVDGWLEEGISPSEIAVLVRQQSKHVTEALAVELHDRGIPYRNEQDSQDLAAEPVAALIFNFVWVVAADRRPDAYVELMRVASRASATDEAALQFDSQLKGLLRDTRAAVRSPSFARGDLTAWRPVITEFLDVMSRPALNALSSAYQRGARLDEVIEDAQDALGRELAVDGDPVEALKRLSELDAVRILTIHKCKGHGVREGGCAWRRKGALLGRRRVI